MSQLGIQTHQSVFAGSPVCSWWPKPLLEWALLYNIQADTWGPVCRPYMSIQTLLWEYSHTAWKLMPNDCQGVFDHFMWSFCSHLTWVVLDICPRQSFQHLWVSNVFNDVYMHTLFCHHIIYIHDRWMNQLSYLTRSDWASWSSQSNCLETQMLLHIWTTSKIVLIDLFHWCIVIIWGWHSSLFSQFHLF